MSFFRFRLRQICDKDFVLLQIVLQKTEIMNQGKTVFAQIMSLIPRYEFDKCVKRYNGNIHAIEFKCRG